MPNDVKQVLDTILPKKPATRPYAVFENGKMVALIRTRSPERAIAIHNAGRFEAIVADADAMFKAAKDGFEIVDEPKA